MLLRRTIRFECSGKRTRLSRTLPPSRHSGRALRFAITGLASALLFGAPPAFPASSIPGTTSPVASENARQGSKDWELSKPATKREIEGYASNVSVRPRETVRLHVSTASKTFDIEIYRLGWYGGLGARLVFRVVKIPGGLRPTPAPRKEDGLVECRWPVSYTVPVGDWVSGVYLAKRTASGTGRQAYVPFVVLEKRGLARPAPFLFQCSVTTRQAYNAWGGKSLYDFNSKGETRARRVSFNRPYGSGPGRVGGRGRGRGSHHGPFFALGRLGVSDDPLARAKRLRRRLRDQHRRRCRSERVRRPARHAHRGARRILVPAMRANVEAARDRGVSLGIFAANVCYWQFRLEPSPYGGANRVMFCTKDAEQDSVYDTEGDSVLTVRFRDLHPRRPENSVSGMMISGEDVQADFVPVPAQRGHWVFAGTGIAKGTTPRLPGLCAATRWIARTATRRSAPPVRTPCTRSGRRPG